MTARLAGHHCATSVSDDSYCVLGAAGKLKLKLLGFGMNPIDMGDITDEAVDVDADVGAVEMTLGSCDCCCCCCIIPGDIPYFIIVSVENKNGKTTQKLVNKSTMPVLSTSE